MQQKNEIKVLSVNVSAKRGAIKNPVDFVFVNEYGITNDAHSGAWHRQVSLLAKDSIDKHSELAGREIKYGEFAENITTDGFELHNTSPLDRLLSSRVELEISQIGKECHGSKCAIFKEVGECIMPKEGVFAKVLRSGKISPGDVFTYHPRVFTFQVITLSDRVANGDYEDLSGPEIINSINQYFEITPRRINIEHTIIPDDKNNLAVLLERAAISKTDVLITTGGTGIGKRDITIETVKPFLDKEIPGIMEMLRVKHGTEKPKALLSRGIAGLMNNTLVYTLPGSVQGVKDYMTEILKTLEHLIYVREGLNVH